MIMVFNSELNFEINLISVLTQHGWEENIISNPTEEDLINNWADILFMNNREIDRLNNQPLTKTEMRQIIEQIETLKTPVKLNGFINGKTITIKRDNPNDKLHYEKEISLKIYDRQEIAAGSSKYQIASQPIFKTPGLVNDRRGDLTLLINGMPVIHIELKKSGIPVSQATNQIEKYSKEGAFKGIYSLIQIFVGMTPEETVYFSNPGSDNKFNSNYFFHWADFNNEPINDWKSIVSELLSIPMAHQLIGFYTVADNTDGMLKVMRSYQYYAAHSISDKVAKTDWTRIDNMGGYVEHTTGSGKTMTSFKSAQLIATSKDADKVIFLVDRIELGTQSFTEYKNFANENEEVQATETTDVLVSKLKSKDPSNILIVTSIQKMSRITEDKENLKSKDIEKMQSQRIVFIVDEAHRSTFGEMLFNIKRTFRRAIFFGFTGTPIYEENGKKDSTTADVFGNQLHRYSIADGIRDKNVLGFDLYKVETFKESDIKKKIALEKVKANYEEEAINDPSKSDVYYRYLNKPMAGYTDENGTYVKGIEDYLHNSQYDCSNHRMSVVNNIIENWNNLSRNSKFHSILATQSIREALEYYRIFKEKSNTLKVTCLFDPTIDNGGYNEFKENGVVEVLEDYNANFGMSYDISTWANFKKDVGARLAHKSPYISLEQNSDKQIDILIVVNQMLTGFDSKWINTLYVDKVLKYEQIIQAFSRTNRIFGHEKPFGTIKYYRKPNTMEKNIEEAIKLYSGNKPFGIYVPKLTENLKEMKNTYKEILEIFKSNGIENFNKLPDDPTEKAKFSKLFKKLFGSMESAKIQGFDWDNVEYKEDIPEDECDINFCENEFLTLAMRYKELSSNKDENDEEDIPYEIEPYLTEIKTESIDTNYMNSRFDKYLKSLDSSSPEEKEKTLKELHNSFASLSQEEQKYANIFLHDIDRGEATIVPGKTIRDYITDYQVKAKEDQISKCANTLGLNEEKLRYFLDKKITSNNINEFGKFDELMKSVDKNKAKDYFEKMLSRPIPKFKISLMVDKLLRKFILSGGFDITELSKNSNVLS